MALDAAEVRRFAALARLRLDDAEAARFAAELSRVVDWVDQLGVVEITPAEVSSVLLRADVAVSTDPEPLLAASAGRDGRFVRVPAVVGPPE